MTDKLELKSSHEVVYTVDVADVDSIFQGKPIDPDILTVVMKDGKRLYCDEVCPIDSMQEEPVSEVKFILPQKISGNINCENCLYSSACALGDIQASIIDKPVSEDLNEALAREWKGYNDRGAATVDALEDNTQELAFAKGFYRGAEWQKERDKPLLVLKVAEGYKHALDDMEEQVKEVLRTEYEKGRHDALEEMKKEK